MKQILIVLAVNLCALALSVGAVIMAVRGIHGWGWMIFGAFCLHVDIKFDRRAK